MRSKLIIWSPWEVKSRLWQNSKTQEVLGLKQPQLQSVKWKFFLRLQFPYWTVTRDCQKKKARHARRSLHCSKRTVTTPVITNPTRNFTISFLKQELESNHSVHCGIFLFFGIHAFDLFCQSRVNRALRLFSNTLSRICTTKTLSDRTSIQQVEITVWAQRCRHNATLLILCPLPVCV